MAFVDIVEACDNIDFCTKYSEVKILSTVSSASGEQLSEGAE